MHVTNWDDMAFHMVHTFIVGDKVIAEGTSLRIIISKDGAVSPTKVMLKIIQRLHP